LDKPNGTARAPASRPEECGVKDRAKEFSYCQWEGIPSGRSEKLSCLQA